MLRIPHCFPRCGRVQPPDLCAIGEQDIYTGLDKPSFDDWTINVDRCFEWWRCIVQLVAESAEKAQRGLIRDRQCAVVVATHMVRNQRPMRTAFGSLHQFSPV